MSADAKAALEAIEAFAYANPGHGFSCGRMATLALGKPDPRPDLPPPSIFGMRVVVDPKMKPGEWKLVLPTRRQS